MECPSCGAVLPDTVLFCPSCGRRITAQPGRTPEPPEANDPEEGDRRDGTTERAWPRTGGGGFGPGRGRPDATFGAQPLGTERPERGHLAGRLRRLARLDTSAFTEMRDDPAALTPALLVAGVAILLMALGGWLWWQIEFRDTPFADGGDLFLRSVVVGTILGVVLWVVWVWVTSVILARRFKRQARWGALLRPLGPALAPLALGLFMFLDALADPLRLAIGIAAVVAAALATQIALQECTDATPGEVFVANLAGFAVWALALSLLGRGTLNLAPGIWMFG